MQVKDCCEGVTPDDDEMCVCVSKVHYMCELVQIVLSDPADKVLFFSFRQKI